MHEEGLMIRESNQMVPTISYTYIAPYSMYHSSCRIGPKPHQLGHPIHGTSKAYSHIRSKHGFTLAASNITHICSKI